MKIYKKIRIIMIIATMIFVSGCTTVPPSRVLSPFGPTMYKGTIPLKVGMCKFVDKRPEDDKKSLNVLEPIDEKVTAVLYKEFEDCKLFKSITMSFYPKDVDIILKGEILSFNWEHNSYSILYVPPIFPIFSGMWAILGGPTESFRGSVGLFIQIIDAKTGNEITSYQKEASQKNSLNIYNKGYYYAVLGQETRESFRLVFDQLKESLLKDAPNIVEKVKKAKKKQ